LYALCELAQKSFMPLWERRISEQRKQPVHDRRQTYQHHEQLEKLRQPRVGSELIDDPKQDRAEDDCDKDSDYQRYHCTPRQFSREVRKSMIDPACREASA
jgi:hypothetical protein